MQSYLVLLQLIYPTLIMKQETRSPLGGWLVAAILLIGAVPGVNGRPFLLTFNLNQIDTNGLVSGYNVFISNTNNGARRLYGRVNHGVAQCPFDTANLANPVFFSVTTQVTNGAVSPYSAPLLFDTNNYPAPTSPAPPVIILLTPPTGLKVQVE